MLDVINKQTAYNIRKRTLAGDECLVVPITMLTEGVHCGSQGCLYYNADVLREFASFWAGKPLTVNHPVDGLGKPCQCNDPVVYDNYVIGNIFNVQYDPGKKALKGDGWISIKRLRQIDNILLDKILNCDMINVSTGMSDVDLSGKNGMWNNEEYINEVIGMTPDHLAILPNDSGACGLNDGCGIRNQKGGGNEKMKSLTNKLTDAVKRNLDRFFKPIANADESMMRRIDKIREYLDSLDTPSKRNFLTDVLADESVIYESVTIDPAVGNEIESVSWRAKYAIADDESVTLTDHVKVKKEISYTPISDAANNLAAGDDTKSIANKTEDKKPMGNCADNDKDKKQIDNGDGKVAPATPKSIEEVIANSGEFASKIKAGLALLDEKRKQTIDSIMNAAGNKFDRQTLENMPCEMLANISALAIKPSDDGKKNDSDKKPSFLGNAGAPDGKAVENANDDDDKPLEIINFAEFCNNAAKDANGGK